MVSGWIIYAGSVVISGIVNYIYFWDNYEEYKHKNEVTQEIKGSILLSILPFVNVFCTILMSWVHLRDECHLGDKFQILEDECLNRLDEKYEKMNGRVLEKENTLSKKKNQIQKKDYSDDFQKQIQELEILLEQAQTKKEIKSLLAREKEILKMHTMLLTEQSASLVESSECTKEKGKSKKKKC